MTGQAELDPVSTRLNVIIRLLLEQQKRDTKQTVGDQIVLLESSGLKGKDVANILGLDVAQLASYRRFAKMKRKLPAESSQPPETNPPDNLT